MSRLVAVSNRISVPQARRRARRAGGGIAGRHAGAARACGSAGTAKPSRAAAAEPSVVRKDGVTFASIDFDQTEYQDFYLGFCNGTLVAAVPLLRRRLPLQRHAVRGLPAHEPALCARCCCHCSNPTTWSGCTTITCFRWRRSCARRARRSPWACSCTFRFPNIEVLRVLPVYGELLQAMLAYDVLGFQTETDRDAFRGAAAFVWGAQALTSDQHRDARRPARGDRGVSHRRGRRRHPARGGRIAGHRRLQAHDRRVVRPQAHDRRRPARLQQGPGRALQGLRALPRDASGEPEPRDVHADRAAVAHATCAPTPRSAAISSRPPGRTNGRFADTDWTPIRYLNRNFPHDVLMGFMRSALIGIVTPVRDGMNLVAKEFVAAQDPADPGVLILSTLAGAARELTSAVHGESLRLARHGARHPAGLQHAAGRAARASPGHARRVAAQFHRRLAFELRANARVARRHRN